VTGVPPSGSGHSPEVEPSVPLSPAKPSVPNAGEVPHQHTGSYVIKFKRKRGQKMLHISDGWYAQEGMCGI
jgi:hypothetical protein